MNVSEKCGFILGHILGVFTFTISCIRRARMFHPRGCLFEAEVASVELSPHALVRLSTALWKEQEWRDVLGIAIRFMPASPAGVVPAKNDQDLLFASFPFWWMTPIGPFVTHYHDFFGNTYYTVADFMHRGKEVTYRLVPETKHRLKGCRDEKLMEAVLEGNATFILEEKELEKKEWRKMATIKLTRPLHYDQEALRFNPFQSGGGIHPKGFLQYLRIGTYKLSQLARPVSERPSEDLE